MIISAIIRVVIGVLGAIFAFLPTVTELPWGVDQYLSDGMGYFNRIAEVFPPLGVLMDVFLIYIGFKATLLLVKVFLGSRAPALTT